MSRPIVREIKWRWQQLMDERDRIWLNGHQSCYFNRLMDLGDPVEDKDAATKKYVDDTAAITTEASIFALNSHDHIGGDGAQIDHGGLAGLEGDDHKKYALRGISHCRFLGLPRIVNLAATDADLKGFCGGFTDGRYGYFVPYDNGAPFGKVARIQLIFGGNL